MSQDVISLHAVTLPREGMPSAQVLEHLQQFKTKDIPWQQGRAFAYVFEPDAETKALVTQAYASFLSENGLDPSSFPSLLKLETDLVSMVANLLGGDGDVVGNFTTGGTESIILAVKTARDYCREHRPHITQPEIIIGETAHAAFQKACHYLGVKPVVVPVCRDTFQLDTDQVLQAITPNTILLVGSTPNYSHGVMDNIEALAAIAHSHDIFCHVDACVGGFYLPFAKKLGYDVPPFDFSVTGVTSMSCDLHKYGYAAKGASIVLYKNPTIRKYQFFTCSTWTGYSLVNPTILSSKSGGAMAGAWAALNHLGEAGYMNMAADTQAATRQFMDGIRSIDGLTILGNPVMNLVAVASTQEAVSVFVLADMLKRKGWHIQVQFASPCSPEALHLNINRANVVWIPALLDDIREAVAQLRAMPAEFPQIPLEMLTALFGQPNAFDALSTTLGMNADDLPDDFAPINNLLNQLPPAYRDVVLTEFVNRMYTTKG